MGNYGDPILFFLNGFMGNYGDTMCLFYGFMGNYGDPMCLFYGFMGNCGAYNLMIWHLLWLDMVS